MKVIVCDTKVKKKTITKEPRSALKNIIQKKIKETLSEIPRDKGYCKKLLLEMYHFNTLFKFVNKKCIIKNVCWKRMPININRR